MSKWTVGTKIPDSGKREQYPTGKGTQNEIRVANERGIPVLYEGEDELS